MTGRNIALATLLAAVSAGGALYLFGVQFADGGTYPQYSSLRSDPVGAKLLFDTLGLVPGTNVARNYLPLEYVSGSAATILILDLNSELFTREFLASVDVLASRGNRVVIAIAEAATAPENKEALAKTWKVRFGFDAKSPRNLKLFFAESTGWKSIGQEGDKVMAVERPVGKGSVALFADTSSFANSTLAPENDEDADADTFARISTAIGPYTHVIFDERHFGISQSGSVVGLVRHFRLTGMALGFSICAALFIWRNVTAFPPPQPVDTTKAAGRTSRSGLLTLLRRHVPASELATTCWNEWLLANRRTVTPERARQAQEIARSTQDPVQAMRDIQSIVNAKGTL